MHLKWKIYNNFYTETKTMSVDKNPPKFRRGKNVLKISSRVNLWEVMKIMFPIFCVKKCFIFLYLFVNPIYLFIYFYFPIGTLGRSHRQNNFQQNQWLTNRFWFGCDQPQGRRFGKGTWVIQLIYFNY